MSRPIPWLFLIALAGCGPSTGTPGGAKPPEAKPAEQKKNDADLARTTLAREAAQSLGVISQPVELRKGVQDHAPLTGWVAARPGREVTLTAPLAGYIRPVKQDEFPALGQEVGKQKLFAIEPVLTQLEQFQMVMLRRGLQAEHEKAREDYRVAKYELDNFDAAIRGKQAEEQAKAKLKRADEDLRAAKDKVEQF